MSKSIFVLLPDQLLAVPLAVAMERLSSAPEPLPPMRRAEFPSICPKCGGEMWEHETAAGCGKCPYAVRSRLGFEPVTEHCGGSGC